MTMRRQRQHHDGDDKTATNTKATPQQRRQNCDRCEGDTMTAMTKPRQCDDEGDTMMATTKPQQCDSEGTATTRLRQRHRNNVMMKVTSQWQRRNCDDMTVK